jgi:hypothetical protein
MTDNRRLGEYLLSMQSGMMQAPPYSPPIGHDEMTPNERAALRLRPQGGAYEPQPQATTSEMVQAGMMLAPGPAGLVGRAITAAPKAMAGGLAAALLGAGTGQAGENEFQWTDPDKERTSRIGQFETLMNNLNKEMVRASKARMPSVQKQMDEAIRRNQADMEAQRADREAAFGGWQKAQEEKKRRETSFFDMVPGSRAALTAAALPASYLTGRYFGKRFGLPAATGAGAAGGALEGVVGTGFPTEVDILSLPASSPTRQEAMSNIQDPSFLARLLLAGGVGAGAGALGALKGYGARFPAQAAPRPAQGAPNMPPAQQSTTALPATTPGAPGATPVAPSQAPALPPSAPAASGPPPGSVLNPRLSRIYGYPVWVRQ